MAKQMTCDGCGQEEAVMLLQNLQQVEVVALGPTCLPAWLRATADAMDPPADQTAEAAGDDAAGDGATATAPADPESDDESDDDGPAGFTPAVVDVALADDGLPVKAPF